MRNEGYVELFDWDTAHLEESAIKVVDWYSYTLKLFGSGDWFKYGKFALAPMIRRQPLRRGLIFNSVLFEGDGISLRYYHQYLNNEFTPDEGQSERFGAESNPHFIFSANLGMLLPREFNTVLRVHEEIGKEARDSLNAEYERNSWVIAFPKEHYAKPIYKGRVPLFNWTGINKTAKGDIETILNETNF